MKLREALQHQAPSLTLQRAAADEIARLDAQVATLQQLIRTASRHFADGTPLLAKLALEQVPQERT